MPSSSAGLEGFETFSSFKTESNPPVADTPQSVETETEEGDAIDLYALGAVDYDAAVHG